ncbi:MAG: hypothetical protein ACK4YL_20195, partial [Microcystis sp.]
QFVQADPASWHRPRACATLARHPATGRLNSGVRRKVKLGTLGADDLGEIENSAQQMSPAFLEQASSKLKQLLGHEFQSAIFKDVQKLQSNNRAAPERSNIIG